MQNKWSKNLLGSAEKPWLSFVQYSILHSDKFTIIRALTLKPQPACDGGVKFFFAVSVFNRYLWKRARPSRAHPI